MNDSVELFQTTDNLDDALEEVIGYSAKDFLIVVFSKDPKDYNPIAIITSKHRQDYRKVFDDLQGDQDENA
jgi:hypothetical protein